MRKEFWQVVVEAQHDMAVEYARGGDHYTPRPGADDECYTTGEGVRATTPPTEQRPVPPINNTKEANDGK